MAAISKGVVEADWNDQPDVPPTQPVREPIHAAFRMSEWTFEWLFGKTMRSCE
jgi:hypothetical protein